MRYKWRQWVIFDCNWKTAIEAFMEPYHVTGTHSQMLANGDYYAYSAAHGKHGVSGFDEKSVDNKMKQASSVTRAGKAGKDPRARSEEHTSELPQLMTLSYAVFCLINNKVKNTRLHNPKLQ